ncbi:hypothetical protein HF325_006037 [Metschnikowia pulcherrima]|uniref:D-lactate dehydratase n=1 Tax=Metschnikowia pulcherrima TaxID=27326 RepID=A0A8H7GN45_9ASCO|nr:hypothetical protein HF325_006037 [Metschnikowia pulcherrima]
MESKSPLFPKRVLLAGMSIHSVLISCKEKTARFMRTRSTLLCRLFKTIKKPSEIDASEYDLFFAAGGHGCLFDFPTATGLQAIFLAIWQKHGVVAAVCHGPCLFENARDSNGEYFLKGKNATGFTDEGEAILQLDQIMVKMNLKAPKHGIEANGGFYVQPADPWSSFTVTDGKFVTKVNPASASETTQKAIDALA